MDQILRLRAHRDLWRAGLSRTDGLAPESGAGLNTMTFQNRRDIPANRSHADALSVLCDDAVLARQMAEAAVADWWHADAVEVYEPSDQVASALGTSQPAAVVEWWWG